MSAKFIYCTDGSYLNVRNITRIWVAEDTITARGVIKASTIGPAMPFTVAEYETGDRAAEVLRNLIDLVEG